MSIFISWHGDRAKRVAEGLRSWLADVLQKVEPWVSSEDITAGTRWNAELVKQLAETNYGILCLTPESARAHWVLFEAGALANTLGSARVCPYLVQMEPGDLPPPLAQFEAVEATRSGTLKLLRSINGALRGERALTDERLVRIFARSWPDLESILQEVPTEPSERDLHPPDRVAPVEGEALGLERVFRSRSEALTYFGAALRREIERSRTGQGLVYVACTSMRGFLATAAKDFHGPRLIEDLVASKCELRILLTHPETAEYRAAQERQPPGKIALEVKNAVAELKGLGVVREQMKYYRGAPTLYGMATSEAMLLNPYPYEEESHRCMTLVVRKTEDPTDIYHQYFKAHFERPWSHAIPVEEVGP